jgi:hypothetical protein
MSNRTALRMRVLPRFPARISATNGLEVVQDNLDLVVRPDFGSLVQVPSVSSPTTTFFWGWDSSLDSYSSISFQNLVENIQDVIIGENLAGIDALTVSSNQVPYYLDGDGTAATYTVSSFVRGVSDAADAAAFRSDIEAASAAQGALAATAFQPGDLGGAATLNVGTSAGTVAAGDDARIIGAAQKSSNLSDLANAATARTNLGLGGAATLNVGLTAGTVSSGEEAFKSYFPNASKNIQSTGLAGTDGDSLFHYASITAAGDEPNLSVHRVQKLVDYTGGTPGDVKTASWVIVQVEDGPVDFHWAGLDQMINYASAGENVARFSKAEKRGTGHTWAMCANIEDHTVSGAGETGEAIGIEVTVNGNGVDAGYHRNGVNVALHKTVSGGEDLEWGRGFWTSTRPDQPNNRLRRAFDNTAPIGVAVFSNSGNDAGTGEGAALLRDSGALSRGVDLAAATYSTNEAVRLATNQRIAFEVGGSHYIRSTGTVIQVMGARLQPQQGLAFPSSGLVSTTATAGGVAKPATYSGFLSILIDGVTMKVPYYSN